MQFKIIIFPDQVARHMLDRILGVSTWCLRAVSDCTLGLGIPTY